MAAGRRSLHWTRGPPRMHGCLLCTLFPLLFLSQFFASAADFFPLQKPDFAKSPFASTANILLYSISKNFQGSREDVIKKAVGAAASFTVHKYTTPSLDETSSAGSSVRILPTISIQQDNNLTASSQYTIPPDPSRASSLCSISDTWLKKIHGGVLSLSCSYSVIDPKTLLKVLYDTAEISNVEFNSQMQPFSSVGSFLGTGKEENVAAAARGVGRLNRIDEAADAHELAIGEEEEGGKSIEFVNETGGGAAASFLPSSVFEFFRASSPSLPLKVNSSSSVDAFRTNSSPSSRNPRASTVVDVQRAASIDVGNFFEAMGAKLLGVFSAMGEVGEVAKVSKTTAVGSVVGETGLNVFPQEPDDTFFPLQWELRDESTFSVQAQSTWTITTQLGTVAEQPLNTVGIVDTSCLQTHPDLVGKFFKNHGEICGNNMDDDSNGLLDDCNGWNFAADNNDLMLDGADPNTPWVYHGTAVSGCIGASSNNGQGVASVCPHCLILPIATFLFNSEVISGINYLVSQGIRIINFSFGGDEPSTAIRDAIIDTAIYDSVLFVVSSGNSGCDLDNHVQNPTPGCRGWPASFSQHYRNVVSVGATAEAGFPASFSNYGATSVTVFAPGQSVHSTLNTGLVPEIGTISGTSFSAPITAGIAAMVLQQHPSLTSCQLRRILELSCTPNPALVGKSVCNGHLNAETALIQGDLEFQNPTVLTCFPPADPINRRSNAPYFSL